MRSRLVIALLVSLLVAIPIRLILATYPEDPFWHAREVLDAPGQLVEGLVGAFAYFLFQRDPSDYPRIGGWVNFVWLFVVVFAFAFWASKFKKL